jgi:hypothetical protein
MKLTKAGAKRLAQLTFPMIEHQPDKQLADDYKAWLEDMGLTLSDVSPPIVQPEPEYGPQYGEQDGVDVEGPHAELAPVQGSTESMEDPNGNN